MLGDLREPAEVINTTGMRVDELVRRVQEVATEGRTAVGAMPVTITSFGYKYGVPVEADWIIDVRFLENPFYIADLRDLTTAVQRALRLLDLDADPTSVA